jgi:hypothetical protein
MAARGGLADVAAFKAAEYSGGDAVRKPVRPGFVTARV